MTETERSRVEPSVADRRGFLRWAFLGVALVAAYGTAAAYGVRFLFRKGRVRRRKVFVCMEKDLAPGRSLVRRAPDGRDILLTRADEGVLALSNVCPHLGCTVRWEPQNSRFFCPCHAGIFRPDGVAIGGPPAKAGQRLERFETSTSGSAIYLHLEEEV